MVKEFKTPVKQESKATARGGEGFDFFYILAGGGVLIGLILVVFVLLRYVLHMI
jgi:hypothetical protein